MSAPDTVELLWQLVREGLWLALVLAAPLVLAAALCGLLVAIVQAATQIAEPTLGFAPKALAVALAVMVAAPWMSASLQRFALMLYQLLPQLGRM